MTTYTVIQMKFRILVKFNEMWPSFISVTMVKYGVRILSLYKEHGVLDAQHQLATSCFTESTQVWQSFFQNAMLK